MKQITSGKRFIIWIFILLDRIYEITSTKGCITILKEPKSKSCICTNYDSGFTRIPDKFPDFIAELTIENQKIHVIDSTQLRHLPYMVNLTLNNNKLSKVMTNSFAYVPQLMSLRLSGNNLYLRDSSLPCSSFIYLKSLKVLDLSKNPLGFVPDYYFQSLKQLNVLILSGAQKGFFIEENGFYGMSNLQVLDLSYTFLITLSEALSHSFSSMQLQELYLYKNPWNCDCNLQWLKMWFTRYKTVKFSKDRRKELASVNNGEQFLSDVQPECHEPANVKGKNLLSNSGDSGSIGLMDFKCEPKIFTKDRKVEITKGQNLTLTCDLQANPGGNVVWSKNGMVVQKHWQRVSWSTSQGMKFKACLNIFDIEETDNGNWRCILTTVVGKVSATFSVKVLSSNSQIDYKFVLKYVGIGGVTIILLLVVIGIIIYCIYGFQIQNNRRRKSSTHEKVFLKNDTEQKPIINNYRIIARANEAASLEDHMMSAQYYNPVLVGNQATIIQSNIEQSHSPFSHYLVNNTATICPLHGHPNQSDKNDSLYPMTTTTPLVDCSGSAHNANGPCPIHGIMLSYLTTTDSQSSATVYSSVDTKTSSVYSRNPDEYILRVSSSNPATIMTTGPLLEDIKYLSSVPDSSTFSFSAAI